MGYRLSWTLVSHATAYKLQYSIDGGDYIDLTTTTNNYYDLSGISAGGDYVLSVISQATGYTDSDRATIEYKPRSVSYTLTNCSASLQKTVTQYGATFPSFSISPASGYDFGTGATYSVYNGTTPVTLTVSDGIITVPEFIVGGAVTVNVSAASINYSVTNTLTNCTSNNSATSISHGASYSATLTAASGYTLTGVTPTITMSGVAVSNAWTLNADGTITISIASVAGAIAITVNAVSASVPYLTFSSPLSFTMAKGNYGENNGTVQYSTDKSTWSTFTTTAVTSVIQSNSKYEIYFRGTGNTYVKGFVDLDIGSSPYFVVTGSQVYCVGNIENLLDYATVSNDNHPTMASNCYYRMFYGCTSLTSAPSLPATTLTSNCYYSMFSGCTSLTSAPSLPATTLADYCYYRMFYGCTSLTSAPSLPATTLTSNCYYSMFSDCTSLTSAPALPATTLASNCYYSMFSDCTSLTSAPALPATTLASNCYMAMFACCKSLTTVPALPATTLITYCYYQMFNGCTKIKLSTTRTGDYQTAYRIPTTGTGTSQTNSLFGTFANTGGTFTGDPTINTTYYTSNTVV